ncbi:MAG: DUF72 domain-containing protein [Anaerolineae bacterium]|nr:DUF72 domain-containing protein [Anaerolineae bacterium]
MSETLRWYLGTMGYGYKDWQGVFYPEGLPSRERLGHYSRLFSAVEMDSTFYGTPRPDYVLRWAEVTPDAFVFCPKMPREITHELRLEGAEEITADYLETMRLLQDKLGPILIQFPPDFSMREIDNLARFLEMLPTDLRYAVEFRDRSWHAIATGELLQAHKMCWVSTDYLYMPRRVYVTTDFVYIRWLGRHGTYETKDHERVDRTERLREWYEDVDNRHERDGFHTVYGFFNDEYAGYAPATAQKMKAIAGLPDDPLAPPQQGKLL